MTPSEERAFQQLDQWTNDLARRESVQLPSIYYPHNVWRCSDGKEFPTEQQAEDWETYLRVHGLTKVPQEPLDFSNLE